MESTKDVTGRDVSESTVPGTDAMDFSPRESPSARGSSRDSAPDCTATDSSASSSSDDSSSIAATAFSQTLC